MAGTPKKEWKPYVDNKVYDFKQEDPLNPDYNPPDEYRLQVCQFIDSIRSASSIPSIIRSAQMYYDKVIRSDHTDLQHWCLQKIYHSYFFARKTVFVDNNNNKV